MQHASNDMAKRRITDRHLTHRIRGFTTTLPLGEFLDEQLARVRGNENIEDAIDDSDDERPPMIMFYLLFLRVML